MLRRDGTEDCTRARTTEPDTKNKILSSLELSSTGKALSYWELSENTITIRETPRMKHFPPCKKQNNKTKKNKKAQKGNKQTGKLDLDRFSSEPANSIWNSNHESHTPASSRCCRSIAISHGQLRFIPERKLWGWSTTLPLDILQWTTLLSLWIEIPFGGVGSPQGLFFSIVWCSQNSQSSGTQFSQNWL